MIKLDLNQTGGLPLSTQILDAMQIAYNQLNAYGNFAGEKAIIVGCEDTGGGNINDGYVFINGEPLFFKGAPVSDYVVITEIGDERGFEDGSIKPVIYDRYATFGSNPAAQFAWSSFRRPLNLFQLEDEIIKLRKATPIGMVAIWGNFIDDIPEGWLPWDISQGCVIVSRNPGDANFGAVLGTKIGVAQVTLDISQIPSHGHGYEDVANSTNGGADIGVGYDGGNNNFRRRTLTTSNTGGGSSHTNIQPTLIADHMIFVGF